ncbi:hypothetical protein [Stenotrophomonas oahuensis]|uniref:Uncharacterized protein n=1 Tax=Stenotrophomonas oahuensis TaxID=3003271 RepID=A0ABY9YTV5_9GAMM|nr:hypothetical protein [Stenotrophomonas sp. A5586]WNH53870.1 hypothetical protein PDM29_06205 [Stenotrophomonas sp. A5586]
MEEARWLVEHGYPTKDEQQRLKALTLSQVKAEADAGSPSAKVVYASKLSLEPGKFHSGALLLHDQAVAGNLYAYYGLSEAYWNSNDNRNLVDSAAYLRVAYLLGDSRAGDQIGTLKLSQAELAVADQRAASLLNTFAGGLQTSRRPLE